LRPKRYKFTLELQLGLVKVMAIDNNNDAKQNTEH